MSGKPVSLRSAADLIEAGLAPEARRDDFKHIGEKYAIAITPAIAGLIDPKDPRDPVARQFMPDLAELMQSEGERADPIGDGAFSPVEGIVHRYPDRVLLKLLHVCAAYCRFCFRREIVGPGGPTHLAPEALATALDYIRAHPEIFEVILTGGDPFMLAPRRLRAIMLGLREIPHVKIIRIHTRAAVADPMSITKSLVSSLRAAQKPVYIALHANHPRELSAQARAACARLIDAGFPMLSQSVLLAGVNDDIETLTALMRSFVEARIKPYYMHQLDRAPGTAHFHVPIAKGRALMRQLRGAVSGLCQPTYMLDLPGGDGKSPIGPNYITETSQDGVYEIEDYKGVAHSYSG